MNLQMTRNLQITKTLGIAAASMLAGGLITLGLAADPPAPVTYWDSAKVAEALAKTGLITRTSQYMVAGAHREKPGQVEVHEKTTDILFVVDGEAIYVTGGTMVGGKQTSPGEWLGERIDGGVEHHLKNGDVIVVPAGTPHWFKEVTLCNNFMVRVTQP